MKITVLRPKLPRKARNMKAGQARGNSAFPGRNPLIAPTKQKID